MDKERAEKAYQASCMTADDIGELASNASNCLVSTVALQLVKKQQEISGMLYQIKESI